MKIANHLESDQFWGKYDPIGGVVVTGHFWWKEKPVHLKKE